MGVGEGWPNVKFCNFSYFFQQAVVYCVVLVAGLSGVVVLFISLLKSICFFRNSFVPLQNFMEGLLFVDKSFNSLNINQLNSNAYAKVLTNFGLHGANVRPMGLAGTNNG